MAESFRLRNDSAISSMPALCMRIRGVSGRHHSHRTRRRPPSQSATAHACCPSPAPPQERPAPNGNTQRTPPCRTHQTGHPKRPEYPGDTSGYHPPTPRRAGECSDASSPAGTPHPPVANAVKRERISCSGAGAVSVPEAANSPRNLPQQAPYTSPLEQGQRSSWLSSTWFSSVMPTSIKNAPHQESPHQKAQRKETPAPPGIHIPQQNGRSCFQSLSLSEPTRLRFSGNAYSAIARAGVSAAEGLPTYAPRYLAAGWESATLVWPLPKMFSRRVLPSYSVR